MNPEKIRKISSYPLRWRQWKHPQALLSSVDTPGRGFLLLSKYSIMQNAFIAAGVTTPEQLPQELCIRTLFAKAYNIHNCTLRFLEQCQTKIPETNRERREG